MNDQTNAPRTDSQVPAVVEDNNTPTLERPRQMSMKAIWKVLENLHGEVHTTKVEVTVDEQPDAPFYKVLLAGGAGVVTPLFCLAMSILTGKIASYPGTASFALGSLQVPVQAFALLTGAVLLALLIVSTPHIAQAKLTFGWAPWQAWSFAVAIDATIAVSELAQVFCREALQDVSYIPALAIIGGVCYSAAMNIYVNWLDIRWSKVCDPREDVPSHK